MNDTMKGGKVGTASPLQVDVIRRLKTIALTSEASDSTAQGILAGLNKCEALFARIGTREGFREVLEVLEPLSDVVVLVKRAIRKREGLVVTPSMLEGLREIITWHAKSCGAALQGKTAKGQTDLGMLEKEFLLSNMMDRGTTQRHASFSARSSTLSVSSRSRISSFGSALSLASSNADQVSKSTLEGAELNPCVELASPKSEIVVSRETSTAVHLLLVARFPGGTAIRRWCSGLIDGFVSRARFWM